MEVHMSPRIFGRAIAGLAAVAALTLSGAAKAAQPAISFTSASTSAIGANYNLGWEFTVGASDIVVNSLGFFDSTGAGLATSHQIALWTTGGAQLATATVNAGNGNALVNGFRYSNIAGFTLTHGTSYVIGATTGTIDQVAYSNFVGLNVDSAITLVQNMQDDGSHAGLSFNNLFIQPGIQLFAGPNFQYSPAGGGGGGVPEPGSIALLAASGFSGMGVALRSRRNRK